MKLIEGQFYREVREQSEGTKRGRENCNISLLLIIPLI